MGSCVQLYSLAETPKLPSPRIWAHIRGRSISQPRETTSLSDPPDSNYPLSAGKPAFFAEQLGFWLAIAPSPIFRPCILFSLMYIEIKKSKLTYHLWKYLIDNFILVSLKKICYLCKVLQVTLFIGTDPTIMDIIKSF
jgi:hypothetical protein